MKQLSIHWTFILFLLGGVSSLHAQFLLRVTDPARGWPTLDARIEEAAVTLAPHGAYSEVGIYLTFSAKGKEYSFAPGTPLEISYAFDLPARAMVTDSWLWIDDTIVHAQILDRWTASTIYEGIVSRRKDPSILTKESDTHYLLKVYPLPMGKSRKVKLSFLLPNEWTEDEVRTLLDRQFFTVSNTLPPVQVRILPNEEWKHPRLSTYPELPFQEDTSGLVVTIPDSYSEVGKEVGIVADAPWTNGLYVAASSDSTGGIYQVGFLPKTMTGLASNALPARRILALLQYSATYPAISAEEYRQTIKEQLIHNLKPGDYFNVIQAGVSPSPVSSAWMPATAENIRQVFDRLVFKEISGGYIPGLLAAGMSWIQQQPDSGYMLLLANSTAESNPTLANLLLKELAGLDPERGLVPCYIGDFSLALPYSTYYVGGIPYQGNGYLYENLARQSKGEYLYISCCQTFAELVAKTIRAAGIQTGDIDFHTEMTDGFCFSRFFTSEVNGTTVDLSQPVFQMGRYRGNWPMMVELAGESSGTYFFNSWTLDKPQAIDTSLETIWNGLYILDLESKTQTNARLSEIIGLSLQHRVLSRYTAFLCLEPAFENSICLECINRTGGITGLEEIVRDSALDITIGPNPFFEVVHIHIEKRDTPIPPIARLSVYNSLGQEVYVFSGWSGNSASLDFDWKGQNQSGTPLPGGTYFLVLQSAGSRRAIPISYLPRP